MILVDTATALEWNHISVTVFRICSFIFYIYRHAADGAAANTSLAIATTPTGVGSERATLPTSWPSDCHALKLIIFAPHATAGPLAGKVAMYVLLAV